jgi:hypothetical protein
MPIPKHEQDKKTKGTKKTRLALADMPHRDPGADYRDAHCVAEAIDGFASIFSTWVTQERNGDNGSSLYSSQNAYPVRVQVMAGTDEEDCTVWIECEALDRMATAFERIADAMTAKRD